MQATKIIGWLVFLGGISLILFTISSSYNIFTGKAEAPQVFVFEDKKETAESPEELDVLGNIQDQVEAMMQQQMKEVLPSFDMFSPSTFAKVLNLAVWSLAAGVLIFGGAQISSLGVRLLNIPSEKQKEP